MICVPAAGPPNYGLGGSTRAWEGSPQGPRGRTQEPSPYREPTRAGPKGSKVRPTGPTMAWKGSPWPTRAQGAHKGPAHIGSPQAPGPQAHKMVTHESPAHKSPERGHKGLAHECTGAREGTGLHTSAWPATRCKPNLIFEKMG